jgi:hypothetical protein
LQESFYWLLSHGLQQNLHAGDIGLEERRRIENASVDMRFGRKVYDSPRLFFLQDPLNQLAVADIAPDESVVASGNVGEILQIARVGQLVQIDHTVGPIVAEHPNKMAADKTTAAGD